jgi:hypothetical protein
MAAEYVTIFKRFFLVTALICAAGGCGLSGSSTNNSTGSIAAKLTWSSSDSKVTAKTLYAAPAGVTAIKISVYSDASMAASSLITSKEFTAIPGENGSGTIDGIPAGNGRVVKVEGSGVHSGLSGTLIYLGTATVDIVAGPTPATVPITMAAPVTSASPASSPVNTTFEVTLTTTVPATVYYTSNEPATIYYTTNNSNPTTDSTHGTSPLKILVEPPMTLKFFAGVKGLYEAIQTKDYSLAP